MLKTSLAALAALLMLLAVPAGALAMVQIDRGIAGARLGNSRAEVRAALGTPKRIIRGTNDFGPFVAFRYSGGLLVNFQGRKRVSSVSTTGRGDRTAKGVGVGSSEAAVKAKVEGVKCETVAGSRSCHTHELTAGQRVTDFLIAGGKVTRITVGRVLD
jgi:hypothetical protein